MSQLDDAENNLRNSMSGKDTQKLHDAVSHLIRYLKQKEKEGVMSKPLKPK